MRYTPLLFIFLFSTTAFCQKTWFGERQTNTAMFLDPTEVQMSGSIVGLLNTNILENQYIPFGFGASQSILSKQIEVDKKWEIVSELGSFTQFEWIVVNEQQQRNLINIDYRITFSYNRQISKTSTYRIRFFHVSSHLGDDYIIRNSVNTYTENKMNYEQLEFTYFHQVMEEFRIYGGLGSVVRPNSLRLPFSYHLGFDWNKRKEEGWSWTIAGNLKSFQETDFNPNLKLGIGPCYFTSTKAEPIRIILEYYKGNLPYSQFEPIQTEWIGIGLYFYI